MLDEQDKEWILGAISGAILKTVPGIVDQRLENGLEAQKVWFSNEIKTQLKTELEIGLNKLREELTDVMRKGFSECASAKQVDELTGYVEEVREMVGDGFAECASAVQIKRVEDSILTKDHFDQYIGEDSVFHKKQSTKFTTLVEALRQEKLLSTRRANVVLALEPHPVKLNE